LRWKTREFAQLEQGNDQSGWRLAKEKSTRKQTEIF
jgi:hypothetical protein